MNFLVCSRTELYDFLTKKAVGRSSLGLPEAVVRELLHAGSVSATENLKEAQVTHVVSTTTMGYYFEAVPRGNSLPNLRDKVYFK